MFPAQFGSEYEKNIYLALAGRKLPFRYQVPELGGWTRGGTIIDFVIQVPGALQEIALFVDGPHWHSAKNGKAVEDQLKRNKLTQRGYRVMVVEDQSASMEGAAKWVKENIQ